MIVTMTQYMFQYSNNCLKDNNPIVLLIKTCLPHFYLSVSVQTGLLY